MPSWIWEDIGDDEEIKAEPFESMPSVSSREDDDAERDAEQALGGPPAPRRVDAAGHDAMDQRRQALDNGAWTAQRDEDLLRRVLRAKPPPGDVDDGEAKAKLVTTEERHDADITSAPRESTSVPTHRRRASATEMNTPARSGPETGVSGGHPELHWVGISPAHSSVSNNNLAFEKLSNRPDYSAARGSKVWSAGRHRWSVKIASSPVRRIFLGVVRPAGFDSDERDANVENGVLWLNDGTPRSGLSWADASSSGLRLKSFAEEGNEVHFDLDFDAGTLTVRVDDHADEVVVEGVEGPLCACALLDYPGEKVRRRATPLLKPRGAALEHKVFSFSSCWRIPPQQTLHRLINLCTCRYNSYTTQRGPNRYRALR